MEWQRWKSINKSVAVWRRCRLRWQRLQSIQHPIENAVNLITSTSNMMTFVECNWIGTYFKSNRNRINWNWIWIHLNCKWHWNRIEFWHISNLIAITEIWIEFEWNWPWNPMKLWAISNSIAINCNCNSIRLWNWLIIAKNGFKRPWMCSSVIKAS